MSDEALHDLGQHIARAKGVTGCAVAYGELNVQADAAQIEAVMKFLRDDKQCQFINIIDVCGVDYPTREKRFDVVYHLLSPKKNVRVRIRVQTDEQTPVPSICGIFPGANWFEREAYDLYGILFTGHPELRRLLRRRVRDEIPAQQGHAAVEALLPRLVILAEGVGWVTLVEWAVLARSLSEGESSDG